MWRHLIDDIMNDSVAKLAKRTGLPYLLIYNIINRRVKSLSARHYRIIFGEDPPAQKQKKTEGTYFRQMVELWLFLNDGITKSDLYWELLGPNHTRRVDYRIFTGQIQAVDPELVKQMEKKFSESGIDPDTVRHWTREWAMQERQNPIAYAHVRPLLAFIKDTLGIHPSKMLNQHFKRYESGELKTVPRKVYDKVLELKKRADKALATGNRLEIEKLKEAVYGRKRDYTLYAEVEEELAFLKQYANKGPKKYLGRSAYMYTKGGCKRLPSWRAQKIIQECSALIMQDPRLPLRRLPSSIRRPIAVAALSVFKARMVDLLLSKEGLRLEKQILKPIYGSDEYKKQFYGVTRFDMAGSALGMRRKAFDLMVVENCELFRKIGTYSKRWYLSNLYLKELSQKHHFDLISNKYEWLAKKRRSKKQSKDCMN
jgi:hypothetical protein